MTYTQVRECFPVYGEWGNPKKDELRLRALRMIPLDHLIVICKLGEMMGEKEEFTAENMKWMYLFADEETRKGIISGYMEIIDDINKGKV